MTDEKLLCPVCGQPSMDKSYQLVNTDEWIRKVTYEWFRTFTNPTYCFGVKIDISDVIKYSKETSTSFFVNFLYIISKTFNEIDSLKLRYVDGKVLLFNQIDPTFTVKTMDGSFNNAGFIYTNDYQEFYRAAKREINKKNKVTDNSRKYNSNEDYGVFYSSCITSIDLENFSEPLNTDNKNSINVPRIFWDKYRLENGRYVLLLNITVSHILVDGEELSSAFNLIRKYCADFQKTIK